MTTLPEEAVKAALDTWQDHEFDGTLDYPRMRNALTAALPHLAPVRVKKLAWIRPPLSDTLSRCDTDFGTYRTWTHDEADGKWFWSVEGGWNEANGDAPNEEAAKAAAQADYEARILPALEPSAARELALEEHLHAIEQQLAVNLGYFHDEKRFLLETLQAHITTRIAAIRALSSPDHADAGKVEGDGLPQDVINLVIAARDAFDAISGCGIGSEIEADLGKALEAFASRVPYENEPDVPPSAPASEGAE